MDQNYQKQLAEKADYLNQLLSEFSAPPAQIFESPEQHYRMRAEFRIWHEGERISYAMFEAGQKANSVSLIKLDDFPVASLAINQMMPVLLQKLSACEVLKNRLYQVEFISTLSGEMLISLIYHKKLDDEWQNRARQLSQELQAHIMGRSRGQKVVLTQDFVVEKLTVHGQEWVYKQLEGGFIQPNASVCQKMLAWASEQAQKIKQGDLLEWYCGNGNFTLPLSRHFRQVLATEISKASVSAAHWNMAQNGVGNIKIARLSAQEFAQAYGQARPFRRLQEQEIDLKDYDFSTIFIDPPRAGVDEQSLQLVQKFANIIYVSCNPLTLKENLKVLTQTHEVQALALFDQFPFTHHIECGVFLVKKP